METTERKVIGVFMKREDAVAEIKRLHNKGYRQSDIRVYSNPERAQTVERLMGIDVKNVDVSHVEEDTSWWESIKHSFRFFVYEDEDRDDRIRSVEKTTPVDTASIKQMIACLKPYEQELAAGNLVIVVDHYGSYGEE